MRFTRILLLRFMPVLENAQPVLLLVDKTYAEAGFTLIEMSIVLVIIGLIVGGILTGQELIRNAGIRATIGQLEKYNTAAYTFRNKYGSLPGDITSSQAAAFGFYNVTGASAGTQSCGDGNGFVQGYSGSNRQDGASFGGEIAMFFLQLSQAGLIDGMYGAGGADVKITGATTTGGSTNSLPFVNVTTPGGTIGELLPAAKLGKGNFFTIGSVNGNNYFILTGVTSIDTDANVTSTNNLTPNDGYNIDVKIDNGLPSTGRVVALDTVNHIISWSAGTGITTLDTTGNCIHSGVYYTSSSTFANAMNCSLRINFQ